MTGNLIKREKLNTDRHAQREDYLKIHREKWPSTSQGRPRSASHHQKQEGEGLSLEPSEGARPADLGLLASRTLR